ncbi:MAG: SDR family oxidoreductase [Sphingomonadales bacterium]
MRQNPFFDLTGKTAVITGSSRGIGRSIAENMASLGAQVVITSRKQDACDTTAAAIHAQGGQALAVASSLDDQASLEAMLTAARDAFGKIDILVCNAAINPYYGPLADLPDDVFDKMMRCNVRSNLFLCKQVLPEMAARRDGVVQIISSIGAVRGNSVLGAYGVTKAADAALVRNLAVEWGPKNIRVNCLAPGLIKTDFARALWENPKLLKQFSEQLPLGRIGEPDDIGAFSALLATRAGAYMTGQMIIIDGGATITQNA